MSSSSSASPIEPVTRQRVHRKPLKPRLTHRYRSNRHNPPLLTIDHPPHAHTPRPVDDTYSIAKHIMDDIVHSTCFRPSEERALAQKIAQERTHIREAIRHSVDLTRTWPLLEDHAAPLQRIRTLTPTSPLTRRTIIQAASDLTSLSQSSWAHQDHQVFQDLSKRLTLSMQSYWQLTDQFVLANRRLALTFATAYMGYGVSLLDLIQEATISLLTAIDLYDIKRKTRFSTYAIWWLQDGLNTAITDQRRPIRVPTHIYATHAKSLRCALRLQRHHGSMPTAEELAQAMELSVHEPHHVFQSMATPQSLEQPSPPPTDTPYYDPCYPNTTHAATVCLAQDIPDHVTPSPEAHLAQHEQSEILTHLLGILTPEERTIIELHYELTPDVTSSLEEIAQHLFLSRDQVPLREKRALQKITTHAKQQYWELTFAA